MKRIQLSRKKGARIPRGTIGVARPSRWGNPFRAVSDLDLARGRVWCVVRSLVTCPGWGQRASRFYPTKAAAAERAVELFRRWLARKSPSAREKYLAPLRGAKALACWCPLGGPCHADVLIEALEEKKP